MSDNFFKKRRAAAAFKHAILSRYPVVFASKVGSTAADHRVVFLDGYAGRGRYEEDGAPGSPLLLAESANKLMRRNVFGFFVERNKGNATALRASLSEVDTRMQYEVLQGDLDDQLVGVLTKTGSAPLFAFLDPFGTALDYSRLRDDLLSWKAGPTEVLLHFTALGVARIGGILRKARGRELDETEQKQVTRVDRFLGGPWWREHFADASGEDTDERATNIALRISARFADAVHRETGFHAVTMPVRPRPDLLPKYVLTLFTRHTEGLWCFSDTLGAANLDWHEAWLEEDEQRRLGRDGDQGILEVFTTPTWRFERSSYESRESGAWVEKIQGNIATLLRSGPFKLCDQVVSVYGDTLGVASEKHVRRAVKALHAQGVISNSGVGKNFHRELITPMR